MADDEETRPKRKKIAERCAVRVVTGLITNLAIRLLLNEIE